MEELHLNNVFTGLQRGEAPWPPVSFLQPEASGTEQLGCWSAAQQGPRMAVLPHLRSSSHISFQSKSFLLFFTNLCTDASLKDQNWKVCGQILRVLQSM